MEIVARVITVSTAVALLSAPAFAQKVTYDTSRAADFSQVRTFSIRAGLLASTVTPGRTAPLVSLTTPAITLCAAAPPGSAITSAQPTAVTNAILMLDIIGPLL